MNEQQFLKELEELGFKRYIYPEGNKFFNYDILYQLEYADNEFLNVEWYNLKNIENYIVKDVKCYQITYQDDLKDYVSKFTLTHFKNFNSLLKTIKNLIGVEKIDDSTIKESSVII